MPDQVPTVTYLSDKPPTLEEAQKIVGGYVEMVPLPDGRQILVDEDGLSKRLPSNLEATILLEGTRHRCIVGPALVLDGAAKWN